MLWEEPKYHADQDEQRASGRDRQVGWALKGKRMVLWCGDPQDVSRRESRDLFLVVVRVMGDEVAGGGGRDREIMILDTLSWTSHGAFQ